MLKKIAHILTEHRKMIFIFVAALIFISVFFVRNIPINGKLEGFYMKEHPYHESFEKVLEFSPYKHIVQIQIKADSCSHEELISDMKPSILGMLEKEPLFKGYFKRAFDNAYYELVEGQLKNEVMNIFGLNYLQASDILYEDKFRDLIINEFLRRENYEIRLVCIYLIPDSSVI